MRIAASFTARVAPSAAGGTCLYLAEATITLGLEHRVIHLASDFRDTEPCIAAQILGHEQRHVALDDKLLTEAAQSLRAAQPEKFAALNGVWGADEAAAREETRRRLRVATEALERDIQHDRKIAHALQIDTPEERRRLLASCNGRLVQLHPEFR